MDDKPKNKPVSLAEALQFTDAELEANRNGILADTQINLIYPRQTTNKLPIYLALGMLGFFFIPLIWLGAWRSGSTFWTLALGIVELGLLVAFGYFVYHAHDDLNADIEGRVVEQVSGVVTFRIAGSTPTYHVCVQGMEFPVSHDVMMTFSNLQVYRLYYTPRTHVLLSAEKEPPLFEE